MTDPTSMTSGPEKTYFAALRAGRFQIQQCGACRSHVFFPRVFCPHCGSTDLQWVEPQGAGTVYSTTTVRRKAAEGGDYNVALVDLSEGPRLMSTVTGIEPGRVRIGMAVKASVEPNGDSPRLVFTPVEPV